MQYETRRKSSRFVSELKPLFPGYMFVSANTDIAPWRTINSTFGVSRLVNFGGSPKPIPIQLISVLKLRCDASGVLLPPKTLNEGDSIRMLTGPFANFIARVETIEPKQRVWVLMDFMGQKTRMQVATDQIKLSRQDIL